MYPDRPLQACLHKGWPVYKKNTGRRKALCELFSSCCKGPSGEEGGECRRPNPPAAAEWGMAEPQSPRPQDDGTPNPLHAPLQPMLPVPPVEKPYEWHIESTPQASLRYFKRAIVLRNGGTEEQQNGNLDKPL